MNRLLLCDRIWELRTRLLEVLLLMRLIKEESSSQGSGNLISFSCFLFDDEHCSPTQNVHQVTMEKAFNFITIRICINYSQLTSLEWQSRV
jgi:hypothetical protein